MRNTEVKFKVENSEKKVLRRDSENSASRRSRRSSRRDLNKDVDKTSLRSRGRRQGHNKSTRSR